MAIKSAATLALESKGSRRACLCTQAGNRAQAPRIRQAQQSRALRCGSAPAPYRAPPANGFRLNGSNRKKYLRLSRLTLCGPRGFLGLRRQAGAIFSRLADDNPPILSQAPSSGTPATPDVPLSPPRAPCPRMSAQARASRRSRQPPRTPLPFATILIRPFRTSALCARRPLFLSRFSYYIFSSGSMPSTRRPASSTRIVREHSIKRRAFTDSSSTITLSAL